MTSQLYIRVEGHFHAVDALEIEQRAEARRFVAMANGQGASGTPPIPLYDEDGHRVGRIAWNGRVFLNVEGMQ